MRELKFRVWLTEEKQMANVYSLYFFTRDRKPTLEMGYLIGSRLDFSKKGFEIMQFTGLRDKNGKEIYEGDIVRNPYGDLYIIRWVNDKVSFMGEPIEAGEHEDYDAYVKELEVIGNIYENPELLGGLK